MSEQVFLLPDLGEGLTEAELVTWLVKVGESIGVDQPIAELETAKSVVEVPSPFAGVVSVLHGAAGEVLEVGKPLITVTAPGAVSAGGGATAAARPGSAPASDGAAAEAAAGFRGAVDASARGGAAPEAAGGPGGSALVAAGAAGTVASGAAGAGAGAAGAGAASAPSGSGNVLIGYGTSGHGGPGRSRPAKRSAGRSGSAVGAASVPGTVGGATPPAPAGVAVAAGLPASGVAASAPGARAATAPAVADDAARAATAGSAPVPAAPVRRVPLVVSPLVRRLAAEHGIALGTVAGSGDQGLVLRRDIESAIAALAAVATPPAAPLPAAGLLASGTVPSPAFEALQAPATAPAADRGRGSAAVDPRTGLGVLSSAPLTGLRRAAAANLSRSRREIPEATVWVDVDATALAELRHQLKAKGGHAPSLLAFISRFAVAGLERFPALNTRLDSVDGMEQLVSFDGINLGFAAQTERGLVVPVVRDAHRLSARGLDDAIRALATKARGGTATPRDLGGGTFTVNNYGVFGVDGSAAIINHPEVAMLGIGRLLERPWVVDGVLAVRQVAELTLAFDHRVCDGGTAAGFLRFVADAVENPGSVLADL
ncbi:dihydrolipoamide acetyltransferase family protein [Pseudarthrobacter sp. P1]|uniref:dihydrolipoamide acetyltransferase family protein n=1 Tax=Pseudarthrobacter sp. P1 TaxID=3418418 RepID=UPI003CEE23BB